EVDSCYFGNLTALGQVKTHDLAVEVDSDDLSLPHWCRDEGADLRQRAAQRLVLLVLEGQAAVETAANAGDFLWVQRQVLLLRHADAHAWEVRHPGGAAEALAANVEAVDQLGAVAVAHLQELDAGAQVVREVTHQVAEVDALRRREVGRELRLV